MPDFNVETALVIDEDCPVSIKIKELKPEK